MATSTKPQDKTKTTKTRAVKTVKAVKATPAKTVKATTTKAATRTRKTTVRKAVPSKVAAKPVETKSIVNNEKRSPLRTLHLLTALVSAALIAAVAFLMDRVLVPVTATYLTRDDVASQLAGSTVFGPAVRNLYTSDLRWQIIAPLAVMLLFSLLYLTVWKKRVAQNLTRGVNGLRWLQGAIVVALLFELLALLSGVTDIAVIKLLAGLIGLSAALGFLAERQKARAGTLVRSLTLLSLIAFLLPWAFLVYTVINSFIYGMVVAPWYVYALYASLLLSTLVGAFMLRRRLLRRGQWNDSTYSESQLAALGLATVAVPALILIFALQK